MNRSKIEWCSHTWNPVVGCKENCYYCYAERMNKGETSCIKVTEAMLTYVAIDENRRPKVIPQK